MGAEFIHLIASEASDISERQQKKVISPEHVVEALTTLGFQEYVVDVKAVHKEYKEQASVSGCGLVQQLHVSCDLIVSLETSETWAEQTWQARDSWGGITSSTTAAVWGSQTTADGGGCGQITIFKLLISLGYFVLYVHW